MTAPPLRVLHVITGLERGGAETALVRLLGGLDRAGFEAAVVSLTDRGTLGDEVEGAGALLHCMGWRRGRLPRPAQLWRLARLVRRARPDLVQTWLYHADVAGLLAARLAGRMPVLWNIRCSDMDFSRYGRGTRLTVRLAARLSSLPAGVVVNSAAGQRVHAQLGYRPRAWHLIANGIDTGRFRPDPAARVAVRAEAGLDPDLPLIGHAARLDPQKDHDGFLRALALLAQRGLRFQAVLAGRETERLAPRLRELGLHGRVHPLGERRDMPALLAALDIFCMSSAYGEGFPNVLAEAMACGVPAVATDVGDAGWILDAPDRLVPPRDHVALADALAVALGWPAEQHAAAGAAARRRVEAAFPLARNVARYAGLYEATAARHVLPDRDTRMWRRMPAMDALRDPVMDAAVDTARMDPVIAAMNAELLSGPEIYHPSRLWQDLNRQNTAQLKRRGIENFKRSVNQNYFNFLPLSLTDAQLGRLLREALLLGRLPLPRSRMVDPDRAPDGTLVPPQDRIFASRRGWRIHLYRLMVDLLWDHAQRQMPDDRLRSAAEPEFGNPIDLRRDGRLISQDLAHSFLEWRTIAPALAEARAGGRVPVVAEVGAGYGRLASALMADAPLRYWIIDVPPALYISQWYLRQLFPDRKLFLFRPFRHYAEIAEELQQADIAFFTANQIEALPEAAADIAVNISSLHEFKPRQIDNTLGQMARLARKTVYLKQYKTYVNPADRLIVQESAYRLPAGWEPLLWRTDSADPRFFEALFERGAGAAAAAGGRTGP